ncbi:uncharacterized protein LOC129756579 [Uranotaenia lowii]|uniref:uncharacterized protein LOC129756579 n=1 Tax=Uranotaenia lowii TaxID=190385 RepID=UPI00247A6AC0|nr:uncharacterized protein LOC129756579 [Uranotaenia lowii]
MSQDVTDNEGVPDSEYSDTVKALSASLLQTYEPILNEVKANLKELLNKQNDIQIAITEEKQALTEPEVQEINEMANKAKLYKEKAVRIKTQMHQIHQKAKSLRAKALDMQELKVNQCATKLQQLHYEESLVANSAGRRPPNKQS